MSTIVSGTDFVCIPTNDFEAAAKFYTDVIGLEPSKRWGSMPAGEFETGNLTLAVMQCDAFGIEFSPNACRSRSTSTTSRARRPNWSHAASSSGAT